MFTCLPDVEVSEMFTYLPDVEVSELKFRSSSTAPSLYGFINVHSHYFVMSMCDFKEKERSMSCDIRMDGRKLLGRIIRRTPGFSVLGLLGISACTGQVILVPAVLTNL